MQSSSYAEALCSYCYSVHPHQYLSDHTVAKCFCYSALIREHGVLWWACLSVCVRLFVCDRISGTTSPSSPNFLCMLHMAVAQSSSNGVLIQYVFPVLPMTSYLHISWGSSTSLPGWGSQARMQAWAWCTAIPVAGSGRSGLLLAVRAY